MTLLVGRALESITGRTNLSSGLAHPNDMNAAKEMFKLLHEVGEILRGEEIRSWAVMNGWQERDAVELGALGQKIGISKRVRITDRHWWGDDILKVLMEKEN
jgi:hypothetical protein